MGSPERGGEERDGFSVSLFESSCLGHGRGKELTGECCAVCLCRFQVKEEVGELRCGQCSQRVPEVVVRQPTTTT